MKIEDKDVMKYCLCKLINFSLVIGWFVLLNWLIFNLEIFKTFNLLAFLIIIGMVVLAMFLGLLISFIEYCILGNDEFIKNNIGR